jgi:CRISPR/Cas system-associated exonuclease Cas4 (RecB family)
MAFKKFLKKLTTWSYSRFRDYSQCPLKAKLKHVDKIHEPANPAMERGGKIHDIAEGYIKSKGRNIPPELKKFTELFKMLRGQYKKKNSGMTVEETWAFTKDWIRTQWNNWNECVVRIKLDCTFLEDLKTLIIADWKTGKFQKYNIAEYIEQLELYALAALLLHPEIERVKPRLYYLDHGIIYPEPGSDEELIFTQKDVPKLKKLWVKRTKALLKDVVFPPKPNDKCCWCFYRASNHKAGGGQCKF